MNIKPNDPRITAFALGELKGDEAIEMARAVNSDARLRAEVDEIRETGAMLMATLGGGEKHLLSSDQREAIRSAGSSPLITDISSARTGFWQNPVVAGFGVAAALAMMLYVFIGLDGGPGNGTSERDGQWSWSQVDMESLTAPAMDEPPSLGDGTGADADSVASRTVKVVSKAMSRDTASYRRELQQRVDAMQADEIESAHGLPELQKGSDLRWRQVTDGQSLKVPLVSGATSWPWIARCIEEQQKLPPRQAVRIEEMINHFRYKQPSMLRGGGLVADMEVCRTPWSPDTVLLAVHVSALRGGEHEVDVANASATLTLNPERVQRVRLMGYARVKDTPKNLVLAGPTQVSRSQGHYVIYELEQAQQGAADLKQGAGALASLRLGQKVTKAPLSVEHVVAWERASADLRFASVVAACGILLGDSTSTGGLDAARLSSLVDSVETRDVSALGGGRREALVMIRSAAGLMAASADGSPAE